MSLRDLTWALNEAPTSTPLDALVLIGLVNGNGGGDMPYPQDENRLATVARCTPAQVIDALFRMERQGIVRFASHLDGPDLQWWVSAPRELPLPPTRHRAEIPEPIRYLVYKRDGHTCCHCGATDMLTLDHIIPWSRGGSDTEDNLQTLCGSCNSRKGDRA